MSVCSKQWYMKGGHLHGTLYATEHASLNHKN